MTFRFPEAMFVKKFGWTFWPFLPRNILSCMLPSNCSELFVRTFVWTLPFQVLFWFLALASKTNRSTLDNQYRRAVNCHMTKTATSFWDKCFQSSSGSFAEFLAGSREEHSMDQCRSRAKLSENFERHWSIPISGEIHMDQSLVHTFSRGNSYGPMVLKVLQKFPPALALVHGWLFPGKKPFAVFRSGSGVSKKSPHDSI